MEDSTPEEPLVCVPAVELDGTSTTTVFEVFVTGEPSPAGGVPVTVAVFVYEPAASSALLSRCAHL